MKGRGIVLSRWVPLAAAFAGVVAGVLALSLALTAGDGRASAVEVKVSSQVLADTEGGNEASFIVYLGDQADVSAAAALTDQAARGRYVYETLRAHAAKTQASLQAALDAQGASYTSFWGVNMVVVEGDRGLVEELAAREDVKAIEPNSATDGIDDVEEPEVAEEGTEVAAVEPGVNNTQSPALWNLGFRGQGIVVANQDTGMRWTHAALRTKYRGWGGSVAASTHDYNWWDSIHARITNADGGTASPSTNPCGYNAQAPCDDHGHGTHTTGTSVGDDAGAGVGTGTNQIGVAPAATWIGCRNMDSGNGRATTYTECFQFFLAPTNLAGQNADPSKRPHVINNSWSCPLVGELCARNVMKTMVENLEASGIFVVASAGNDGPGCSTVQDPPAIYTTAFSVGAVSATTNTLQSFSSRGAVTSDGSNRMKPDISAPGASTRSSTRTSDTAYSSSSGTSMAGPHVVGTVALLWSAKPRLVRDMPRTKWLLTRSSNPTVVVNATQAPNCGGIASRPNNHFGWGRVDALAAYNLEPSLNQTIAFAPLPDRTLGDPDFDLGATASSGREVAYAASGACTVSGKTLHVTGVGMCTITASQAGLDEYDIAASAPVPYYPAADVSQSFNTAWPFTGFGAPVRAGTTTAEAGRAIPVKFGLGGDAGLDVLAEGYPVSTPVACATGDATGPAAATQNPGKSGLSFGEGEYHYTWKTEKDWAGTCRRLTVKLADNTTHTALFSFNG